MVDNWFTKTPFLIDLTCVSHRCVKAGTGCQAKHVPGQTAGLEKVLDNAPASFPGVLLKVKAGHYYYICTRNNNFTNRSQKGHLNVK